MNIVTPHTKASVELVFKIPNTRVSGIAICAKNATEQDRARLPVNTAATTNVSNT